MAKKGDAEKQPKIRIEMEMYEFRELILWCMDLPEYEKTRLWKMLNRKLNDMIDRDLFTKHKTAPTPEQRETARQQYLDRRGIPESFRW